MDSKRSLLVLALFFISFLVYQQWQLDKNPPQPVTSQTALVSENLTGDVPASRASTVEAVADEQANKGRIITLENDVFRLKVTTLGGDVISSQLLKYDAELDSTKP